MIVLKRSKLKEVCFISTKSSSNNEVFSVNSLSDELRNQDNYETLAWRKSCMAHCTVERDCPRPNGDKTSKPALF